MRSCPAIVAGAPEFMVVRIPEGGLIPPPGIRLGQRRIRVRAIRHEPHRMDNVMRKGIRSSSGGGGPFDRAQCPVFPGAAASGDCPAPHQGLVDTSRRLVGTYGRMRASIVEIVTIATAPVMRYQRDRRVALRPPLRPSGGSGTDCHGNDDPSRPPPDGQRDAELHPSLQWRRWPMTGHDARSPGRRRSARVS